MAELYERGWVSGVQVLFSARLIQNRHMTSYNQSPHHQAHTYTHTHTKASEDTPNIALCLSCCVSLLLVSSLCVECVMNGGGRTWTATSHSARSHYMHVPTTVPQCHQTLHGRHHTTSLHHITTNTVTLHYQRLNASMPPSLQRNHQHVTVP